MVDRIPTGWRWGAGGVAGCAAALGAAYALQAQTVTPAPEAAPQNVYLSGVAVAGKSRDEVAKVAGELAARLAWYPAVVRHQKRTELTSAKRLGGTVDIRAAVEGVFDPAATRKGVLERAWELFTGPRRRDIPLTIEIPESGVAKSLMRFSIGIGAEPKNARLTKVAGRFKAIPPLPGKELDCAAVASSLLAALDAAEMRERLGASLVEEPARARWLKAQAPIEVPAALREARPRITLDDLTPITARLVSFSTRLGASSRNRIHNIQLACRAVDGTVLLPDDVFSYNETVGPRVPSAGFREAPVIVRGRLESGTGGGICQVSSTLYNAALLADMDILRRTHHAIPVHYLPAGRDATVVDGVLDFKFKNTLSHAIAIDAKVVNRQVVFHLYGHPDDRRQVEIVSSGVSRIGASLKTVADGRLPAGKRVVQRKPQSGRRVTITRIVKKGGVVLRREVVSRDYYRPYPGVVRIGSRATRPSTAVLGDRAATPQVVPAAATPVPGPPPPSPSRTPGERPPVVR